MFGMCGGGAGPILGIVGGGPAGCAAAIAFARASVCSPDQVLLFEAGGAVTNKACGDALVVGTLAALDSLGLNESALAALGGCPSDAVISHHQPGRRAVLPLHPFRIWTLARSVLDRALRERAAALCRLLLQSRVTGIERLDGRWRITVACAGESQEFAVDGVIVATGSLGNFAIRQGLSGNPATAISVTQYASRHAVSDGLHFAFRGDLRAGYLWSFPMGAGCANWGVWQPSDALLEPMLEIRKRMYRLSRLAGFSRPRTSLARLWSDRGRIWHSPEGVVSCGDAGGLVDPYSGEGIWAALTSGESAGAAMASFLSGCSGALNDYSQWVGDTFGRAYAPDDERAAFWREIAEG